MRSRNPAMHNEHAFTNWMHHQHGLSEPTCRTRLANCRRIEDYEGDLDQQYPLRLAARLDQLAHDRRLLAMGTGGRDIAAACGQLRAEHEMHAPKPYLQFVELLTEENRLRKPSKKIV